MTLHQLKVFDAVARNLSFTKAARELRISQPSVFQQIKTLEDGCRKKLYVKRGRSITLTTEGLVFCSEVRKIIGSMEVLESRYGNSTPVNLAERFVVGGSHTLSAWVLPTLIAKYKRENPKAYVSLRTKSSPVMESLVVESEVDIALITNSPTSSLLRVEPYRQENMVIVASRHHPLAQKKRLTLAEFAKGPLIIRDIRERRKSCTRELLDQAQKKGHQPNILMTCDSALTVKNAALAGLGIGVIFRDHVKHEIKNGELKTLKVNGLKAACSQSFIIYRADKDFSRSTRDFYDLLQDSRNKKRTKSLKNATPTISCDTRIDSTICNS